MSRPNWQEAFSVNIHGIDAQHRKLLELMANLYDGVKRGYDDTYLGIRVMELSLFAGTHFDTEELLMSEYHFPGYDEHIKEHEIFRTKMTSIEQDLSTGRMPLTLATVSSLKDWYERHLLNLDKKYSSFLNGKGIH